MKTMLLLVAGFAVLITLAVLAELAKRKGKGEDPISPRKPLTQREQAMYFRLQKTFPEHVVLAQVAMSALLKAKATGTRNTFDRKVVDFVLCTKAFEVVAVIELDDSTHKGKEARDAKRDEMLTRAGLKALRFGQVPDAEALKAAVLPQPSTRTDVPAEPATV